MAAEIIIRLTAVPVNGETQEQAEAKLAAAFVAYPPEAIAATLATDIWTNTDAGLIGMNAEIIKDARDEAAVVED